MVESYKGGNRAFYIWATPQDDRHKTSKIVEAPELITKTTHEATFLVPAFDFPVNGFAAKNPDTYVIIWFHVCIGGLHKGHEI